MSKKRKTNKNFVLKIVILVVLFVLPIVLILNLGSTPGIDDFTDAITGIDFGFTPSEVQANLVAENTVWEVGATQEVQITIVDHGNLNPAFVELELRYDPEVLEVDKVESTELWTDELLVRKEIDNEKGKIYLAASQNVGGKYLGNNLVATVTFRVVGAESDFSYIVLNPSSGIATEGTTDLIPLVTSPLVVSISK